ncbi:MAG: hypothetical protein ACXAAO_09570 [Candidatus Thorarchaeota archaeon]
MEHWTRLIEVLNLSIIKHIMGLLEEVEINYTVEDNVLRMHWKTDHFEDLKIKIVTNKDESWAYIVAPFTNFYEVEESKRMKLAYDMLKESWKANGVKFAIDEDDDIIVIAETNDTDLTADEVRTLVGHVVHACDSLYDIYPT